MNLSKVAADLIFKPEGDNIDLFTIVGNVLNTVFVICGILAIVYIIYGGFLMSSSGGDPGKVTKGKNAIIYAVIGLIVSICSFAIVNFVLGELK